MRTRIRRIRRTFKRFYSFIYSASKGFISSAKLSYPLSYSWLKDKPQISRKEIFFPRYLQYGVLGDFISFLVLVFSLIYIYTHIYIYKIFYIYNIYFIYIIYIT